MLAAVSLPVVVLDQITKIWVRNYFRFQGQSIMVTGDFFRLTYIENTGAAFGILKDYGPVFLFVSLLAIVGILYYIYRLTKKLDVRRRGIMVSGFGLILAGAAGNMIDRILKSSVTDFLDFGFGRYRWPSFNVADSAICIGTFILIIILWSNEEKENKVDMTDVPDTL